MQVGLNSLESESLLDVATDFLGGSLGMLLFAAIVSTFTDSIRGRSSTSSCVSLRKGEGVRDLVLLPRG